MIDYDLELKANEISSLSCFWSACFIQATKSKQNINFKKHLYRGLSFRRAQIYHITSRSSICLCKIAVAVEIIQWLVLVSSYEVKYTKCLIFDNCWSFLWMLVSRILVQHQIMLLSFWHFKDNAGMLSIKYEDVSYVQIIAALQCQWIISRSRRIELLWYEVIVVLPQQEVGLFFRNLSHVVAV